VQASSAFQSSPGDFVPVSSLKEGKQTEIIANLSRMKISLQTCAAIATEYPTSVPKRFFKHQEELFN
jgi:hypothetical protein